MSDSKMHKLGISTTTVGITGIKYDRMHARPVKCHPNMMVGDCVPFYFCPRSMMLYMLWRHNRPGIIYTEGQQTMAHLRADLYDTISWAESNDVAWCFTNKNAALKTADFYSDVNYLNAINWAAVSAREYGGNEVLKEGKQAEFLMHNSFPLELIERIGVIGDSQLRSVNDIFKESDYEPRIDIHPEWYY